jgi:hypothetical protein
VVVVVLVVVVVVVLVVAVIVVVDVTEHVWILFKVIFLLLYYQRS